MGLAVIHAITDMLGTGVGGGLRRLWFLWDYIIMPGGIRCVFWGGERGLGVSRGNR